MTAESNNTPARNPGNTNRLSMQIEGRRVVTALGDFELTIGSPETVISDCGISAVDVYTVDELGLGVRL